MVCVDMDLVDGEVLFGCVTLAGVVEACSMFRAGVSGGAEGSRVADASDGARGIPLDAAV